MKIVVLTHSNRTGGVEKFIAEFQSESHNRVSLLNVDLPIGWFGVWGYRKARSMRAKGNRAHPQLPHRYGSDRRHHRAVY